MAAWGGWALNKDPEVEYFYTTRTWRHCRQTFAQSKGLMCERCLKNGIIETGSKERPLEVHHKIPLTADNIHDPEVTLNWNNLELLCKDCHDMEKKRKQKRYRFDSSGQLIL